MREVRRPCLRSTTIVALGPPRNRKTRHRGGRVPFRPLAEPDRSVPRAPAPHLSLEPFGGAPTGAGSADRAVPASLGAPVGWLRPACHECPRSGPAPRHPPQLIRSQDHNPANAEASSTSPSGRTTRSREREAPLGSAVQVLHQGKNLWDCPRPSTARRLNNRSAARWSPSSSKSACPPRAGPPDRCRAQACASNALRVLDETLSQMPLRGGDSSTRVSVKAGCAVGFRPPPADAKRSSRMGGHQTAQ